MSQVKIQGNASGTGAFTIAAPNSNTDRTLTLPDNTGTILTTATPGVPVNGPAFSAYATAAQTISNGVFTQAQFGAEEFDTANCFTSNAFTPTVAGYYQVNFMVTFSAVTTVSRYIASIYKNGTTTGRQYDSDIDTAATFFVSGSKLIYCNGSTDVLTLYVYMQGTGTLTTGSNDTNTNYFQAFLARAA